MLLACLFHIVKGNKQQSNKKGKTKKPKPAKTGKGKGGGGAAEVEPIAEVEIRVGEIVKAWEHPDSDKLWCEEILCGDEKPRQILSGLRHNFSQEQMIRRVRSVVCCIFGSFCCNLHQTSSQRLFAHLLCGLGSVPSLCPRY